MELVPRRRAAICRTPNANLSIDAKIQQMREKEIEKQKKAEERKEAADRAKEERAATAAVKRLRDQERKKVSQLSLKVLTKIAAVKAKIGRALVDK